MSKRQRAEDDDEPVTPRVLGPKDPGPGDLQLSPSLFSPFTGNRAAAGQWATPMREPRMNAAIADTPLMPRLPQDAVVRDDDEVVLRADDGGQGQPCLAEVFEFYGAPPYPPLTEAGKDVFEAAGTLASCTNLYVYAIEGVEELQHMVLAQGVLVGQHAQDASALLTIDGDIFRDKSHKQRVARAVMENHVMLLPCYPPEQSYQEHMLGSLVLITCRHEGAAQCVALGVFTDKPYTNVLDPELRFRCRKDDWANSVDKAPVLMPVHIVTTLLGAGPWASFAPPELRGYMADDFFYPKWAPPPVGLLVIDVRDKLQGDAFDLDTPPGMARFVQHIMARALWQVLHGQRGRRMSAFRGEDSRVDMVASVIDHVSSLETPDPKPLGVTHTRSLRIGKRTTLDMAKVLREVGRKVKAALAFAFGDYDRLQLLHAQFVGVKSTE